MSNLTNSVRLTGFLGAAPEIKFTGNEKKLARISLATHGYRRDANNEVVKTTDWHQLVLWEKQAELAEKYLDKGSEIAIEGRLSNRFYTDKDGTKRYVTEVVVSDIHLFGKRSA
jgi:single-strand DNA-binding protein